MPLPPAPVVADSKERFHLSDFRLGNKEIVGTQETQRIECQLSVKGQDLPLSVTIWLDQKTELPVRRLVICRTPGGGMFKFTESYSKLRLDEKVDTRQFELPK